MRSMWLLLLASASLVFAEPTSLRIASAQASKRQAHRGLKNKGASSGCPSRKDPCVNRQIRDECLALEKDGCPQIAVKDSCPPQFACAVDFGETQQGGRKKDCPSRQDPCVNRRNRKECLALKKDGCPQIAVKESCPLQFGCAVDFETQQKGKSSNMEDDDEEEEDPEQQKEKKKTKKEKAPKREKTKKEKNDDNDT